MMDRVGIHWFRLDLRLNDNPALYQLSKEVDTIIPIYIYEENIQIGEASKCWLEKSLESLDNSLSKSSNDFSNQHLDAYPISIFSSYI